MILPFSVTQLMADIRAILAQDAIVLCAVCTQGIPPTPIVVILLYCGAVRREVITTITIDI